MRRLLIIIPLLLSALCVLAQERKITGKITEKGSGVPVIGASVINTDNKNGATTDANGNFSIMASNGNTIKITYIGFEPVTIKVGSNNTYNLSLTESAAALSEVVVSTGYRTEKKKDITGAVTVVEVSELKDLPNNNPIQALQGRVPGMIVYTDGSPSGSNSNMIIRGLSSINGAGNVPLIVIDGVPTKQGMHELNPNDIESMQVLKDAAAASIYGSRASAGVIVITTKRAKKGELKVSGSARNSYSFYQNKLNVLDAEGYGRAVWQASANDDRAYGTGVMGSYLGVYQFDWTKDASGNYVLNKVNIPEFIDPAKTMRTANTNWFDQIAQTGKYQNYDVMVTKGTDKGSTVFSLDYTDNDGIVKYTNFRRISARVNSDYKLLNDHVTIGENFTANTTRAFESQTLNAALQALPVIPVHTVDGTGWGGPYGGMNDRQNPVRVLEDNKQNRYSYLRLFGNAYADLEILKGLNLRTSVGLDYGNYTLRDMQLAYVSGYLNNPNNQVSMVNSNSNKLTWTTTLGYKKNFGKHALDAFAGTETYSQKDLNFSASRRNFASEDPDYMYLNAGTTSIANDGGAYETTLLSYFGKANYAFADKYLVSGTLRYDGASVFGTNKQYGLFPAFSLGWRLGSESFVKSALPSVSDLKLRFSWGQTGSKDPIPGYANKTLYQANPYGGDPTWRTPDGTGYDFTGTGKLATGYQLTQLSNDEVTWETTTQTNIGLDFGFIQNKISGSIDWFTKSTTDMLIFPPYIGVIGEGGSRWVNSASLKNKGLEFILNYRGKVAKDLNFNVSANIAAYRNKITSLPEEVVNNFGGNGAEDNILGHPVGSGYGYVADGLFRTEDEVLKSADQLGKGLGRIRYKDLNGDGFINQKDQTWILNPTPDFNYGLNFSFDYKAFDLTVFFQGVGNQQINVQGVKSNTDFWSVAETGSNKGSRLLNAWSPANPDSNIPALTLSDKNFESRFSTYFVENGAYMKLRNIQLGYTLPKRIADKIKAGNVNVYVSGQNLFTLKSKNFSGVDPEAADFGYPIPTLVTTGLRVSF